LIAVYTDQRLKQVHQLTAWSVGDSAHAEIDFSANAPDTYEVTKNLINNLEAEEDVSGVFTVGRPIIQGARRLGSLLTRTVTSSELKLGERLRRLSFSSLEREEEKQADSAV
jgi:hypothetical protein